MNPDTQDHLFVSLVIDPWECWVGFKRWPWGRQYTVQLVPCICLAVSWLHYPKPWEFVYAPLRRKQEREAVIAELAKERR